MRYMVHVNDGVVEVPFEEPFGSTAINIAEIIANKSGTTVTVEVIPEEKKDMVEIVRCADCKLRRAFVNASGRYIEMCEEHDIQVDGDFYCPLGPLNKEEHDDE